MNIIEHIPSNIESISINGLCKNAGKTTLLNQLLYEYQQAQRQIGIVSIGVDGERYDAWSGLLKPAIHVEAGMLVATSRLAIEEAEARFEILEKIKSSSIGHEVYLVRAVKGGQVKVTGTPSLHEIRKVLAGFRYYGAEISLVDGAYDRIASSNPDVTSGTFLVVGAAYHRSLHVIVENLQQWLFRYRLPVYESSEADTWFLYKDEGMALWQSKNSTELYRFSTPLQNGWSRGNLGEDTILFLPGSCTGSILREAAGLIHPPKIILRDPTRLFAKGEEIASFFRRGGEIYVLRSNHLLGIAINPTSPDGYQFDGELMLDEVKKNSGDVPVFDVVRGRILA